jgi:hypothetical protein
MNLLLLPCSGCAGRCCCPCSPCRCSSGSNAGRCWCPHSPCTCSCRGYARRCRRLRSLALAPLAIIFALLRALCGALTRCLCLLLTPSTPALPCTTVSSSCCPAVLPAARATTRGAGFREILNASQLMTSLVYAQRNALGFRSLLVHGTALAFLKAQKENKMKPSLGSRVVGTCVKNGVCLSKPNC